MLKTCPIHSKCSASVVIIVTFIQILEKYISVKQIEKQVPKITHHSHYLRNGENMEA